jgi:sugar phosphate isomerase/epimerase
MTYHPGRYDPANHLTGSVDDLLRRERDALARLAEHAATLGVVIAAENLANQPWWAPGKRQHSADPAWLTGLVGAIGHPNLGICFDLGHHFLASAVEGIDFVEGAVQLAPDAVVLHVHDNFGRPVSAPTGVGTVGPVAQFIRGEGDLHLPLGWGRVPLESAFSAARFRRRPIMVLEIDHRYLRDDPDTAGESLAAGRRLMDLAAHAADRVAEPAPAGK